MMIVRRESLPAASSLLYLQALLSCWLFLTFPAIGLCFSPHQPPLRVTHPGLLQQIHPLRLGKQQMFRDKWRATTTIVRRAEGRRHPLEPLHALISVESASRSPRQGREAEQQQQQPQENVAYHLVFSYDPSDLSPKDGGPFRYLEGQSVSFFLKDRTPGAPDQGPPKPRLYSVASSPLAPELGLKHSFSLCVRHHRYWSPDGARDPSKDGLCSSSLCTAPLGSQFDVGGPVGAALLMPEDASVPLIFACTGTGVAPLRSFLRRLSVAPRDGPLIAYVGAGNAATAPYAREWRHLERQLPQDKLNLRFAFSREMKNKEGGKLYVQDLIEEDGEKLLQLLSAGGIMYTCGRKDMVAPIKAALQAAAEKNNLSFDSFFKELIATKRWRTEVY
ncbi:hypothetical protein Emed_002848 [Eimeria media]